LTLAFVGLAVADDPKGDVDEPPVRLKKKVKPKKDKEVDQLPEDPAKKDEAKKDGEAKKPPVKKPPQAGEERKKNVPPVLNNMKTAEERLAKRDPGKDTRTIQKEILKDLDTLIEQTRRQTP